MRQVIDTINNSKLFAACAVLLTSMGGKYIAADIGKWEEEILQHPVTRRLMVGLTCYLATRDVLISLFVTFLYLLLTKRNKLFEPIPTAETKYR